jgi:chemotaxis protein CheD
MTSRIAQGSHFQPSDPDTRILVTGHEEVIVGLAEIRISKGPANFAFIGLGSCIGFCALDPVADVAGAAHIMLPRSLREVPQDQMGKFADTAVGELVRLMEAAGAKRENITAAYAGGANVTEVEGATAKFDIGSRNIESLRSVLGTLKIPVRGADAGGTAGRTMKVATASGDVTVKTIHLGEAVLCSLRR